MLLVAQIMPKKFYNIGHSTCLTQKHLAKLEKLAKDKHSSLFQKFVK
jgi:hypothetical protein